MIGNDIIDLNVAGVNSRWQEQRFLDKLFTDDEQAFIFIDNRRFQNIWRLWSMKESAYKVHRRKLKSIIFNPKYYNCTITSETMGTVSFDNKIVNTTTQYNSNLIYTTAHLQDTFRITEYCLLNGISQSEKSNQVKARAIQIFAEFKSVSEACVSIEKNDFGVPQFCINQKVQQNLLTLTHHGSYGGFAITC